MSGKKPSLGRGLAELSPLLARSAVHAGVRSRRSAAPASGSRTCRSTCCSGASTSRGSTCGLNPWANSPTRSSRKGLVQPILVRPLPGRTPGESQRYEIIAGERRWRAAQMAGIADIPAVIRDVPDEAAVAMSLIENIQREDLNPLEEARALQRLIEEFGLTHQAAAEAVGRSRAAVSNLLRLMELADEVKQLLEQRSIEMGHARALLGLDLPPPADRSGEPGRQEGPVGARNRSAGAPAAGAAAGRGRRAEAQNLSNDPDIRRLELELADKLGAKVLFQHSASGKGKLVVTYNSLDELEGILAHIS